MSTLITLATEASVRMASVQAEGGLLDYASNLNTSAQNLLKGVAVTIGIVLIVLAAVRSRGSFAAIIVAIIVAGLFIAGVWNITSVKDTVQNDLPGAAAVIQPVPPAGLLEI